MLTLHNILVRIYFWNLFHVLHFFFIFPNIVFFYSCVCILCLYGDATRIVSFKPLIPDDR